MALVYSQGLGDRCSNKLNGVLEWWSASAEKVLEGLYVQNSNTLLFPDIISGKVVDLRAFLDDLV